MGRVENVGLEAASHERMCHTQEFMVVGAVAKPLKSL